LGNIGRITDLSLGALTLLAWLVFSTMGSPAAAQVVEEKANRDAQGASSSASQPPASEPEETGPASEQSTLEDFALHAQFTNVTQYHPPFTSPFYGPNSLPPGHRGAETNDLTLYAGARVWDGLEAYVNPEIDQGFGLSDTLGVAGFPSGEAYKIGMAAPYLRLPRAFVLYTLELGGTQQPVASGLNQLAGTQSRIT
jgi:hypothetical protein